MNFMAFFIFLRDLLKKIGLMKNQLTMRRHSDKVLKEHKKAVDLARQQEDDMGLEDWED